MLNERCGLAFLRLRMQCRRNTGEDAVTYSPLNAPRNDEFLRLRANAVALGRNSLLKGEFLPRFPKQVTLACWCI